MSARLSPDCRDGNCQKCDGLGWDEVNDRPDDCQDACHEIQNEKRKGE